MAVKQEGRFANTLRSNCKKIHFLKIDSWSTPGMPDLYGLFHHEESGLPGTFWAELKCTKINKLGLSPQQIAIISSYQSTTYPIIYLQEASLREP